MRAPVLRRPPPSSTRRAARVAAFLALAALAGCRQALGDRCETDESCERGLACRSGICVPPLPIESLETVPLDETLTFEGLTAPVDVVLDRYGTPHVYAANVRDGWAALGLLMARQRFAQLELRRRAAHGTLAELVPEERASLSDLLVRLLGIAEIGERSVSLAPEGSPDREALEGFAEGVTAFLARARAGDESVGSRDRALLDAAPAAWTPADSLAVARLDRLARSGPLARELELHLLLQRAAALFRADAAEAELARRAGFAEDVVRFDPTVAAPGWEPRAVRAVGRPPAAGRPALDEVLAEGWIAALRGLEPFEGLAAPGPQGLGWVAGGRRSASGGGLLVAGLGASLAAPAAYWAFHLEIDGPGVGQSVSGLCPVGVPAALAGFGRDVAWAALPSRADLADLYLEQLVQGEDGAVAARFQGAEVPLRPVTISVAGAPFETAEVPHHGPLVPALVDGRIERGWGETGLALRWTGAEPSRDLAAASALPGLTSARRAVVELGRWQDPSFVWLVADRSGEVAAMQPPCLPVRDPAALGLDLRSGAGASPATVLPGTGEAEWLGCVENAALPRVAADAGTTAVATGEDLLGGTAENTPFRFAPYLGWSYDPGHRSSRLHELLAGRSGRDRIGLEEAALALADDRVEAVRLLVPALGHALARAREEREATGTHTDLMRLVYDLGDRLELLESLGRRLEGWDGSAPAGEDGGDATVAAVLAGVLLPTTAELVLGDELELLGVSLPDEMLSRALVRLVAPEGLLRTASPTTGESTLFDDLRTRSRPESRDERLLRALEESARWLEERLGEDPARWRWGELHGARMPGLPGRNGWGDIPAEGFLPLSGGLGSVASCPPGLGVFELGCREGVVARLAVEMRPRGALGRVVLSSGQGGSPEGAFFDGEADLWRAGLTRELPVAVEDVARAATTRMRLVPTVPGGP